MSGPEIYAVVLFKGAFLGVKLICLQQLPIRQLPCPQIIFSVWSSLQRSLEIQ